MPNTVAQTVLQDGTKLSTVHLFITSDGVEGEFTNKVVIDIKNDVFPVTNSIAFPPQATILQIWWAQSYFDAFLSLSDTVPVPLWVLPVAMNGYVDFRSIGGLKVPVSIDGTNNLLLTTAGFSPVGSVGSYVIQFKKT